MLSKRLLVAFVFIPPFYILVRYLPPYAFFILILFSIVVGLYEFYRMLSKDGIKPMKTAGILLGGVSAFLFYMGDLSLANLFLPSSVFLVVVGCLMIKRDIKTAFIDIAITFFGIFFIAWLMGHQILLRNLKNGDDLILFLYATIWIGDTGAYYVGSKLGRHRLAPVVSSRKSWEGAVGGLLAGICGAFISSILFLPGLNYKDCLALGTGLSILGQLGDLSESMFKRGAEVKDSSLFIPGHGGMLDRMDSFLYTSPALYYYSKFFMI